MTSNGTSQLPVMRFESMPQGDVPKGREGKHRTIVDQLLNDLALLKQGDALKIPLSALPDSKENIRAALSRATRQREIEIATSSDEDFLYVWKPDHDLGHNGNGSKH
jgi:hypothetical protein